MNEEQQKQLIKNHKQAKGIVIILLAIAVTLVLNLLLVEAKRKSDQIVSSPIVTTEDTQNESWPEYSMIEVATHATAEDCWMVVAGGVYDITSEIAKNDHPGGRNSMVSGCGKDMTEVFVQFHTAGTRASLDDFQIGVV